MSWIRRRDIHILTSGPHTFASDYRFEVVHGDTDEDFWGLRIRGVKPDDTGQYECQVNTEPKMSLAYKLKVSGEWNKPLNHRWIHQTNPIQSNLSPRYIKGDFLNYKGRK